MRGEDKVKLLAIVSNDLIRKSNAIVCLEGDGYSRAVWAAKLYHEKLARNIVVSGGYNNPPFSIPAEHLAKVLIKKGVPPERIILEEESQDTYEQSKAVMEIIKKRKWKKIILVASHFHQLRAYLTFLKAMKDAGLKIQIFNAPARQLSWFNKTPLGKNRLELLDMEFGKIARYAKRKHLISSAEALEYQRWKEVKNKSFYKS